jgi:dTDP-D-glucose 4,6-dehydratase
VVNIGSSDNISIQELAEAVRDQVAPELAIEYESAREADADHTHASVGKAGELIGYEPSRTITEGVGEFIEWYRENREWYGPLVRSSQVHASNGGSREAHLISSVPNRTPARSLDRHSLATKVREYVSCAFGR